MAFAKRPLRLQEIARYVNMPQSTVSRFVSALVTAGYAMQNDETLKYQLTLKFCSIGDTVRAQFSLRDISKPYLYMLAQKSGNSAFVSVEENIMTVCLDFADPPNSLNPSPVIRVGRVDSMHSTAAGKVLLLGYSEQMLQKYLSTRGLPKRTAKTLTQRETFLQVLDHIRSDGFAVDDEENEDGIRSVAAPVRDYEEKIVAAIGVIGRSSQLNYYEINRIKELVISTAIELSKAMGYRAPNA